MNFSIIFLKEIVAKNGYLDLDENQPGLGINISDKYLNSFDIIGQYYLLSKFKNDFLY